MLISVENLSNVWNVKPKGVLHVGAHLAEESTEYSLHNWGKVVWIEAQPDLAAQLVSKLEPVNNRVINATVWGTSGLVLDFKVSTNTQSSSLLEFGTHKNDYPDITVSNTYKVVTITLEELIDDSIEFDFLNLDIQGVELEALKGLGSHFSKVKWIYTEVNKKEVYVGCSKISDIDNFLRLNGFKRTATRWMKNQGWGDALYVRADIHITFASRIKSIMDYFKWIRKHYPSPIRYLKRILRLTSSLHKVHDQSLDNKDDTRQHSSSLGDTVKSKIFGIQNQIFRKMLSIEFKKSVNLTLDFIGNEYSGYWFPRNLLDKRGTIWGVGLGRDSSFEYEMTKRGYQVVGFEPHTECFLVSAEQFRDTSAVVENYGLWDRAGFFHYTGENISIVDIFSLHNESTEKLDIRSLWEIAEEKKLNHSEPPRVLKLNIEGAEREILLKFLEKPLKFEIIIFQAEFLFHIGFKKILKKVNAYLELRRILKGFIMLGWRIENLTRHQITLITD